MRVAVAPGGRTGRVAVPASKSQAHRLLICAALGSGETTLVCGGLSKDIAATVSCLNALGADIRESAPGELRVRPLEAALRGRLALRCGESGSTLRFLLPLVGALGAEAVFHMEGRLPERPLAPLDAELGFHGMALRREGDGLFCSGRLRGGDYALPGNVSSQYISALLMALPRLEEDSRLTVTGDIESAAYISMTEDALRRAGVGFEREGRVWRLPGSQRGRLPERVQVEGDYSNAAFFFCAGALSDGGISVFGLDAASHQGDRAALDILRRFGAVVERDGEGIRVRRGALRATEIDAAPIPDLIPALSVVAAVAEGETRVRNAGRLRLKESDRLRSTARLLGALGADVTELDDGLVIRGVPELTGGEADSAGDHRIAMSAAVAACASRGAVTVDGAETVAKSYPRFWEDFAALTGGKT